MSAFPNLFLEQETYGTNSAGKIRTADSASKNILLKYIITIEPSKITEISFDRSTTGDSDNHTSAVSSIHAPGYMVSKTQPGKSTANSIARERNARNVTRADASEALLLQQGRYAICFSAF